MESSAAVRANKRFREGNSESDSVESRRIRVDSDESEGLKLKSPEAKRIQDDLLGILDDSYAVDPAVLGLDDGT